MTLSVDPDSHSTLQFYDPANNLTKIVASGGFTTLQAFDQNGRLTKTTDPDGRWSQDFYDNAGNVTKTGDNAGHTSLQAFDNDNHEIERVRITNEFAGEKYKGVAARLASLMVDKTKVFQTVLAYRCAKYK